jgi:hypothetical protein
MSYKKDMTFSEFQAKLANDFGMPYGIGDVEGYTSDLLIDEPWTQCPECGEPIYLSDCLGNGKTYWDCPACCCIEDGVIE